MKMRGGPDPPTPPVATCLLKGVQTEIGVTGIILIHSYSMVEYILAHLEQVLKTDFEHSYFFKWAKCKKNILILFFLWIHIGASNSSF